MLRATVLLAACWLWMSFSVRAAETPSDPIFDFHSIVHDPLDAKVLSQREVDGLMVEDVEFTTQLSKEGNPERVSGILAYPRGGHNLPAVFWSRGGMSAATDYFPLLLAKKGYFCLNITLPHKLRGDSFKAFDTANPRRANLTRLAVDQMRGITYMAQRPEVDADKIGIGGNSYGGFFATLIAGADPRIKAGVSFFAAGNHATGTNLPQFNQMPNGAADVEVWNRTIDPAWRLTKRSVPFLWGAASNDNWFHLPAVVKTYVESIGEKRLAIVPRWQHGLTENVDQEIYDWFDVHLKKTRQPYDQATSLHVAVRDGKLIAKWGWTGQRPIKEASLAVGYGPAVPWHGWVQRYYEVVPATIEGSSATAEIPVRDPGEPLYVWGNAVDEKGVLISTIPVTATPSAVGLLAATSRTPVNCFPIGEFEPDDVKFIQGRPEDNLGVADSSEHHGGTQCLRVQPPTVDPAKPKGRPRVPTISLWHIPGHSHVLRAWLKSTQPTTALVRVEASPPENWQWKTADLLRRQAEKEAGLAPVDFDAKTPPASFETSASVTDQWTEITINCPFDGKPVEGYSLSVRFPDSKPVPVWIDSVSFEAK